MFGNYLDEVDWKIDDAAQVNDLDLDQVITDLVHRVQCPCRTCQNDKETMLRLVITGALELARRTEAPLSQCLDTSMIWYFG